MSAIFCMEQIEKELQVASSNVLKVQRIERISQLASLVKTPVIADTDPVVDDLSDPIFKKYAKVNGEINRMNVDQLQSRLREIGLEDRGSLNSCRRRLKSTVRGRFNARYNKPNSKYYYDVICVVDFEATCERQKSPIEQVQEIIEFPAFIVDVHQKKIVDNFHEYVKPEGKISEFCTELTGITQKVVDKADSFINVIDRFEEWLLNHIKKNNCQSFAIATDGPWDMAHFFARRCKLNAIAYPAYAKRWINIKKVFTAHYKKQNSSLDHMMSYLGLEFQGRRHCGLDDTHNIANVLIRMLIDGANPVINERISWHAVDRHSWPGLRPGYVRVFCNKQQNGFNLSDSEDSESEDLI
ncbi:3'-5' exoribonuclease 1 [Halotydeus destructor]|nr:3'-5' exoribonuclease 1 [Halotydeus destructor]